MEQMDAMDPSWGLACKVIDTRLDNKLKAANRAAKAVAAETTAPLD